MAQVTITAQTISFDFIANTITCTGQRSGVGFVAVADLTAKTITVSGVSSSFNGNVNSLLQNGFPTKEYFRLVTAAFQSDLVS